MTSSLIQDASQNMKVAAVVSFYMVAALIMVFVNKAVLNVAPDLPLLYLFNQLVIAVILLHGAALITTKVQIPKLDAHTAKKLTPVVSVNIIGLAFNTLCLRGVEASFFQIARGMVLPLTIAVSCIHTHARPSVKVLIAAGIVTFGFLTGISPNKDLPASASPSVISLVYGILSSLFIAVHAVLIKASLPHCNNSTIELAYWTNLGSAVMVAPFVLLNGEIGAIVRLSSSPEFDGRTFAYGTITTGVFGFLLCVAGLLSIKITSPITHMFSSAARSVLQTLIGVWLFSDILTINRATSILVICGGSMYYTWVKHVENSKPQQAHSLADVERGRDREEEHGLVTIFETKDEGDEETATLGAWSASRKTSDKA